MSLDIVNFVFYFIDDIGGIVFIICVVESVFDEVVDGYEDYYVICDDREFGGCNK